VSQLVELYNFSSSGLGVTYNWNSGDSNISYLGDLYSPIPISRSKISQGSDINREDIKITVPIDNPLAILYLKGAVEHIVTLTIYRQIDQTTNAWWKGRVVNVTGGKESICDLRCESVFTSLQRAGNRARYQKQCRHTLYASGCGASKGNNLVIVSITGSSQNDTIIQFSAPDSYPNAHFTGGYVDYGGKQRFIAGHTGNTLTLWRGFSELISAPANSVVLYPGCNKSIFTCINKFNNVNNFGGFPWIPDINPFGGSQLW
jgi:uncharacterized phage protein (TIGR02218 family)